MSKFKPALTSKRWKPSAEEELIGIWNKEKTYAFDPESGRPIYIASTLLLRISPVTYILGRCSTTPRLT